MRKKIFIIIPVILIIVLWLFEPSIHRPLLLSEVTNIVLWKQNQIGFYEKVVSEEEKIKIIKWFNEVGSIKLNKDFAGSTTDSGIKIKLKSGSEISIINAGFDFEIQRSDVKTENVSYWGKHQEISRILDEKLNTADKQWKKKY